MTMKRQPDYIIRLQPLPGIDGEQALRAALKALLRRHGLRCTRIDVGGETCRRNQRAMHDAATGPSHRGSASTVRRVAVSPQKVRPSGREARR